MEVKNLRTYYRVQEGEIKAVDGLSYSLDRKQCVGLIGESGCGKSVSVLSIMRLIYPPGIIVSGEVIFDGRDLLKVSEQEMRSIRGNKIAIVFQEPMTSLNPVFTVGWQLCEAPKLHIRMKRCEAAKRAIELLQMLGIPDADRRMKDYPHQFSGGMQQRIMIAMALSCNPALLIADEPTTSVDVTVQAQILETINNLRTQLGMSVIIVTHNLGLVARYVDYVNVMYAGRLIESGTTDIIYSHPKHPYTIGLIESVPRLDQPRSHLLSTIPGLPPNLARLPEGCAFYPRCSYALDKCGQKRPELVGVEPNHYVACFKV